MNALVVLAAWFAGGIGCFTLSALFGLAAGAEWEKIVRVAIEAWALGTILALLALGVVGVYLTVGAA